MTYRVIRTDTADENIRQIILYVSVNFGNAIALKKLDKMEKRIMSLADNPYLGTQPRYLVLRRQGYRVLVVDENLAFYKVDEGGKLVTIYAVTDHRQDYVKILQGL